jgi:hypothetical protein
MRFKTGLVLCALLTMGMAGCGGSGGDAVATGGGKPSSSAGASRLGEQEVALKFAQCMRDNGVPDWPDPKFNDNGGTSIDVPAGVDPNKVAAAQEKCKQYAPNGGEPSKLDPQRLEALRKMAQCMRDHGFKTFPDPTDQGINGNGSGIDPGDPAVQAAMAVCDKFVPAPSSGTGDKPGTQNGNGR